MKLFFSDRQLAHEPRQYMIHGVIVGAFETRERATVLIGALGEAGLSLIAPEPCGLAPLLKVHADHYLDYLRHAYEEFMTLPGHGPEVLANVHAYRGANADFGARGKARPAGIVGRTGWYIGDLSAVLTAESWGSLLASAETAVAAAEAVRAGDRAAFALCRPPGHHAYVDRASGFCFVNNAAVAAEVLRQTFARVAILDFDTHHGDGTQAIFYARDDVWFGSVHTDPSRYYPHFSGYSDERGAGRGEGHTLNLPLAPGSDDEVFIEANARLIAQARACGAEAMVISAGWDAHRLDPLSKLDVTTEAYARIGEMYAKAGLPTVIVQEGGYSLQAIAEASRAFATAFAGAMG